MEAGLSGIGTDAFKMGMLYGADTTVRHGPQRQQPRRRSLPRRRLSKYGDGGQSAMRPALEPGRCPAVEGTLCSLPRRRRPAIADAEAQRLALSIVRPRA